ncbi:MAG: anaerobic ribonucleoside-triphosphate reductase activating protein [Lachnospiraceae bacterium]|nr:anaerobic ribonucleoside-triphosphate reductase activating protein [Lachnospiraceae bacterium]
MYVGEILRADSANGLGMRVSLFVSGCTNRCKNCFNQKTWDFHYGKPWTPELEQFLMDELSKDWYDGLTILGGEPFEPSNQEGLLPLIRRVRRELPKRNIWMYTGNLYEDLLPGGRRYTPFTDEILDSIDVLVDGPYVEELHNVTLNYRGSENQRIIDMKQTRAEGQVVLSPLNEFTSRYRT